MLKKAKNNAKPNFHSPEQITKITQSIQEQRQAGAVKFNCENR